MSTTLTERYISTTITSLPAPLQDDVRAELEASIADAVEARLDQGEQRSEAERAVLTELGDPGILAASYSDRPLHLIGPRFYLTWWRLLKLLLIIVPICAFGGVALGKLIEDVPIGDVIGASIAAGLGAIVHVAFWVTLVFVILERTGSETTLAEWDVDQLHEPRPTGAGRADLIASIVFGVIGVGVILWDQARGFARIDGHGIPILHPDLWPWGILALLAIIALEVGLTAMIYARRRWTTASAVLNTALAVVFLSWALTLLGHDLLLNPEFLDLAFVDNGVQPDTMRVLGILLVFGLVGISAWDIVDGWLKNRRDSRP